jgi:hypothetical protein
LLQNLSAALARSESCNEFSVRETSKKRVSQESRENFWSNKQDSLLARILKSDSRVNPSGKYKKRGK